MEADMLTLADPGAMYDVPILVPMSRHSYV